MLKKISYLLMTVVFLCWSPALAASVPTTATGTLGADQWYIASDGTLTPTESTYGISLGGSTKTSWGSVTTPMTDAATYVATTDGGTMIRLYDAGYFQAGDGTTDSDVYIKFDGADDDWAVGIDTTTDDYTISLGGAFATDNRLAITDNTDDTVITIGDGVASVDTYLILDGNAEDFFLALDDGTDNLRIGVGTDVDAEPLIDMDATTYALLTYGDITMGGTTPVLTIGDAGAEDTQIVFDGNAQDYYICLDDATTYADDFCIGLGSTVGTTVAMTIDESLLVGFYANVTIGGTTPKLTIGDAGDEDNQLVFSGGFDFAIGVDDTREEFEICYGLDVDQTCAMSIDSSADVTFDTGDVDIADGSLTITIDETNLPLLLVENTNADGTCGIIRIEKDSASPADDDDIGRISFYSDDSGGTSSEFAYIQASCTEVDATDEAGKLVFNLEMNDADTEFLAIYGDTGDVSTGEIEFNSGAVDIDFRIDGDSIADLFMIDAGTDTINMALNAADSQLLITQTNATGTTTAPLIFINDDRTGANANTSGEATLMIDPQGTHAINVVDGTSYFGGNLDVDGALDLGTVEIFVDSDLTPDVSDGSFFITNTTGATLTDFDGTGIVAGQIIVIESAGAIVYDVTGQGLKGGSTDIITADGDVTTWIYNGTDWLLIAFMDLSDDMS